ncbi:unnamed protein product [Amoebophrya sp. A120]|nr:unnamed protein product [Amoebophrya sp. A120]|eukprot:GSA120T00018569001.1
MVRAAGSWGHFFHLLVVWKCRPVPISDVTAVELRDRLSLHEDDEQSALADRTTGKEEALQTASNGEEETVLEQEEELMRRDETASGNSNAQRESVHRADYIRAAQKVDKRDTTAADVVEKKPIKGNNFYTPSSTLPSALDAEDGFLPDEDGAAGDTTTDMSLFNLASAAEAGDEADQKAGQRLEFTDLSEFDGLFLGCWNDELASPAMEQGQIMVDPLCGDNMIQRCAQYCSNEGPCPGAPNGPYKFFAVQDAQECHCTNSLKNAFQYGYAGQCSACPPSSGTGYDPTPPEHYNCGNYSANAVYRIPYLRVPPAKITATQSQDYEEQLPSGVNVTLSGDKPLKYEIGDASANVTDCTATTEGSATPGWWRARFIDGPHNIAKISLFDLDYNSTTPLGDRIGNATVLFDGQKVTNVLETLPLDIESGAENEHGTEVSLAGFAFSTIQFTTSSVDNVLSFCGIHFFEATDAESYSFTRCEQNQPDTLFFAPTDAGLSSQDHFYVEGPLACKVECEIDTNCGAWTFEQENITSVMTAYGICAHWTLLGAVNISTKAKPPEGDKVWTSGKCFTQKATLYELRQPVDDTVVEASCTVTKPTTKLFQPARNFTTPGGTYAFGDLVSLCADSDACEAIADPQCRFAKHSGHSSLIEGTPAQLAVRYQPADSCKAGVQKACDVNNGMRMCDKAGVDKMGNTAPTASAGGCYWLKKIVDESVVRFLEKADFTYVCVSYTGSKSDKWCETKSANASSGVKFTYSNMSQLTGVNQAEVQETCPCVQRLGYDPTEYQWTYYSYAEKDEDNDWCNEQQLAGLSHLYQPTASLNAKEAYRDGGKQTVEYLQPGSSGNPGCLYRLPKPVPDAIYTCAHYPTGRDGRWCQREQFSGESTMQGPNVVLFTQGVNGQYQSLPAAFRTCPCLQKLSYQPKDFVWEPYLYVHAYGVNGTYVHEDDDWCKYEQLQNPAFLFTDGKTHDVLLGTNGTSLEKMKVKTKCLRRKDHMAWIGPSLGRCLKPDQTEDLTGQKLTSHTVANGMPYAIYGLETTLMSCLSDDQCCFVRWSVAGDLKDLSYDSRAYPESRESTCDMTSSPATGNAALAETFVKASCNSMRKPPLYPPLPLNITAPRGTEWRYLATRCYVPFPLSKPCSLTVNSVPIDDYIQSVRGANKMLDEGVDSSQLDEDLAQMANASGIALEKIVKHGGFDYTVGGLYDSNTTQDVGDNLCGNLEAAGLGIGLTPRVAKNFTALSTVFSDCASYCRADLGMEVTRFPIPAAGTTSIVYQCSCWASIPELLRRRYFLEVHSEETCNYTVADNNKTQPWSYLFTNTDPDTSGYVTLANKREVLEREGDAGTGSAKEVEQKPKPHAGVQLLETSSREVEYGARGTRKEAVHEAEEKQRQPVARDSVVKQSTVPEGRKKKEYKRTASATTPSASNVQLLEMQKRKKTKVGQAPKIRSSKTR